MAGSAMWPSRVHLRTCLLRPCRRLRLLRCRRQSPVGTEGLAAAPPLSRDQQSALVGQPKHLAIAAPTSWHDERPQRECGLLGDVVLESDCSLEVPMFEGPSV